MMKGKPKPKGGKGGKGGKGKPCLALASVALAIVLAAGLASDLRAGWVYVEDAAIPAAVPAGYAHYPLMQVGPLNFSWRYRFVCDYHYGRYVERVRVRTY